MSAADHEMVGLMHRLRLACPQCAYDVSANETPRCPECGLHIRKSDYRVRAGLPKSNMLVVAIVGACQFLFIGPACAVFLATKITLPASAEGALVLLSVALSGLLLWFVAYRPLSVLSLPSVLKALTLGGLMLLAVFCTLAMVLTPIWLLGDAFGWW
jgi:hypothetical protein